MIPTPGYWIECSRQQINTDTIYDESESDREVTDIEQQTDQDGLVEQQPATIRLASRHDYCLFEENELDGDEVPKKKTAIEEQWEKNQVLYNNQLIMNIYFYFGHTLLFIMSFHLKKIILS